MFHDPMAFGRAAIAWQKTSLAYARMWLSASEVIWRRSAMMAMGTMSAGEAAKMMFEKPSAFANAAEKAAVAMATNQGAAAVALASVRPAESRARGNARRLRRRRS